MSFYRVYKVLFYESNPLLEDSIIFHTKVAWRTKVLNFNHIIL